ncbi:fungal-specific transcription factor domain-containing protein [Xylogone sp. PMI_703]|nr:fungal-specific transcription factor domain-containing protein [Xylogone sp. PMI_703]
MAPRRIAFNGRFRTSRTRSGCLRCRQRKLKCDEKKPQCQRCCDSNIACPYGIKLTWPDEALSKGIVVGRTGTRRKKGGHSSHRSSMIAMVDSKSNTSSTQLQLIRNLTQQPSIAFLNTTSEDIFVHYSQEVCTVVLSTNREDTKLVDAISAPSTPTLDFASLNMSSPSPSAGLGLLNLAQSDSFLFEFYVHRMCPTCALIDARDNGHRNVIIPVSMSSSLLLKSVLAVAANHLRFHDPRHRITALQYRGYTLKTLQQLLQGETHKISKIELLSTILMLCFFDISDGCKPGWMEHLDGANKVLTQLSSQNNTRSDEAVLSFLGQYFASHNILAYTALAHPTKEREQSLLQGGMCWLKMIQRPEQEIDCIVGCSTELLTIILELSQRIRSQKDTISPQERHQIFLWKVETERRLTTLVQTPLIPPRTSSSSPSPADSQGISTLLNTAESFRKATLILLQYLCPSLSLVSTRQSTIKTCVREILDLMSSCPISPVGARSSSLWPYFIAACHVTEDQDRIFVLRRFDEMESRKRFGNIRPVREVVECAWKQSDLRADGINGIVEWSNSQDSGLGRDNNAKRQKSFVWEEAMALLGINLSLT